MSRVWNLPRRGVATTLLAALLCAACTGCATTAAETASKGRWVELKSPRFVLWTDGDPVSAARLVADLERFHEVVQRSTNAEERVGAPPLRIFLARDRASFVAWTRAHKLLQGLFVPSERGNFALIDGSAKDPAPGGQPLGAHILFHEYTHYVMAMQGARVPSWYNEGFAEYMATTTFRDGGSYTLGCPPLDRVQWVNNLDWLPIGRVMDSENVATLIQKRSSRSDSYAQSWYAVHYFNADAERQSKMKRYLAAYAAGSKGEEAALATLGMSYAQLDGVLKGYAQSPSFECVRVEPTRPLATPEVETRPISTAEAHQHVGDLLLSLFGPTPEAFENLEQAAKLAPGDAKILIALARAHARKAEAGDESAVASLAKAEEQLKSAEHLAADDPERLSVLGDVHRLRARTLHTAGDAAAAEELKLARSAYRKAIHKDETLAEAFYGLGLSYLIEDDGGEEAQVVLEGAAYLLPLETQVAAALGSLQLARGNYLQAIAPLEYVLAWTQDEKQREAARTALETIRTHANDANDANAADAPDATKSAPPGG